MYISCTLEVFINDVAAKLARNYKGLAGAGRAKSVLVGPKGQDGRELSIGNLERPAATGSEGASEVGPCDGTSHGHINGAPFPARTHHPRGLQ